MGKEEGAFEDHSRIMAGEEHPWWTVQIWAVAVGLIPAKCRPPM